MRNLLLTLRFDGQAYHGWQVQPNGVTVQQCVQDAVEAVTGVRSPVTGCSRTDAGVHALMYCCNFRTAHCIPCERLIPALNAHLPHDIAVYECREVAPAFHARYDCSGKEYVYRIWNSRVRNPFLEGRALHYPWPLDAAYLDRQAQCFVGLHDFSAFCAAGGSVEDKVRTVRAAQVTRRGDDVFFAVEADGFLYHMVRIMVGTLLACAEGKLADGAIATVLAELDRSRAGATAQAQGLYLNRVFYPGEAAASQSGNEAF
ncbi:MAG TPA: tRNA pseudouridine(38-40) synthase TruA [Candidatus Fimivicinus intestinavium]|nr:tRNA pseudouridine(38-40) synthase TruA [Candidatus Fimivicinus intestinavium]